MDQSKYSTLEVNERAQSEHGKFLSQNQANSQHGNMPEVDNRGHHDNLPQVPYSDLPEPVRREAEGNSKIPTICGMRRKPFWILLGVILAILIIAGLVGGLAGGLSASKSKSSSSSGSTPTTSTTPTTPTTPITASNSTSSPNDTGNTSILSTTRLGSVNFTDAAGYDNYLVFYQLENQHLYQSAYNSSWQNWTVSLVTDDTSNIKNGTPIACDLYWHSISRWDFHVYWLNPANVIQGRIWGGSVAATSPDNWTIVDSLGTYTAASTSSLVAYGRECEDCLNTNLLFWEDPSSNYINYWDGSVQEAVPTNLSSPANGTGLALAPVRTLGNAKFITIYLTSKAGNLTQYVYNGVRDKDGWYNVTLPTSPDKSASIAAFTYNYNDTSTTSPAVFQVLNTHPDANTNNAGTTITGFTSSGWANDGTASIMSSVVPDAGIAANQAGRVYGIREEDGEFQLVEWTWSEGSGVYGLVGVVNTTVTS
ncbi:hypothetical protein K490DRAFT_68567 [Saccharata proteae CBS 121410]|uniref:Fucose-specific lectin n=1 Tax=Saccharata proteae CBS 121410 TaxID=1314787 RepID=A0A9P4HRH9_9PEZI|nr:hypothetical protein K490DRAFT_68567 [Saccharata proteae CBS 121410]